MAGPARVTFENAQNVFGVANPVKWYASSAAAVGHHFFRCTGLSRTGRMRDGVTLRELGFTAIFAPTLQTMIYGPRFALCVLRDDGPGTEGDYERWYFSESISLWQSFADPLNISNQERPS